MFKRVLMAAAVAAAVSAPAFAEVTISGSAELDVMYYAHSNQTVNNADGTKSIDNSGVFAINTPVVISFDGKDKWDNGLSTIWRISQKPNAASASNNGAGSADTVQGGGDPGRTFGSREAFIGVAGDFGSVKFGRMFAAQYLQHDWPYLTDGSGNVGEDLGVGDATAFWNNAIQYQGAFGPVGVFATFDAGNGAFSSDVNGKTGYEIGGSVDVSGFHFDLSYLAKELNTQATAATAATTFDPTKATYVPTAAATAFSPAKDFKASKVFAGARGAFGPVSVALDYNRQDIEGNGSTGGWGCYYGCGVSNNYHAKLGYSFNDKLSLNAGVTVLKDSSREDGKQDANAWQGNFQLNYSVGKNTAAFVQYRYLKLQDQNADGSYRTPVGLAWEAMGIAGNGNTLGNQQRLTIGTWTGF